MNKDYSNFPQDSVKLGWVKGLGVFRSVPWHFVGLFLTAEEANDFSKTLDQNYQTAYGSHRLGSDDFVF